MAESEIPNGAYQPYAIEIGDQSASESSEFELNPRRLWGAFQRRWWLGVLLGLIAAVPVSYLAYTNIPTPYRAESEIRIFSSRPRVNYSLHEDQMNFRTYKQTQMKDVIHPATLAAAIDSGDLLKYSLFQNRGPDFDPVNWLQESLKVQSSGEEFFIIALEGEDPKALAEVVNAVRDAFMERSRNTSQLVSSERYKHIQKELNGDDKEPGLKAKIASHQERLDELSQLASAANADQMLQQQESIQLDKGQLVKVIRDIDLQILQLSSQKDALAEADQGKSLQQLLKDDLENAILSDPRYEEQSVYLTQKKRELEQNRKIFNSEKMQPIVDLKKEIAQAEADLETTREELRQYYQNQFQKEQMKQEELSLESIQRQIKNLSVHRDNLSEEYRGLNKKESEISESSLEFQNLQKQLEDDQRIHDELSAELRKMKVEQDAGDRIVTNYSAEVPRKRETKKRNMLTAGGGLGSLGFFIVLVTLLEFRHQRVHSLKCLEEEFDFAVLGTIPHLPARFVHGDDSSSSKASYYQGIFMEAVDSIRTILLNRQKKTPLKTLMVSSALSGEGKSTLSCHLAISFARAGRRTLLIDFDLRSPRIHEVFQTSDFPGVCEVLREEIPNPAKCIESLPIPRLDFLPAGDLDSATLMLLASDRLQEVLDAVKESYDIVIIDSAPLLPVADSLQLIQQVDGVVLSVRKDVSRISKIESCIEKIRMLGGNLLGGVVIGLDESEYGYRSNYSRHYRGGPEPRKRESLETNA
ncbi:MAG: polysaccharide biosynthesis tyrosine autokinase [Planctomycetaceae bacterium]|nr:polysaccharide biosynthesis tyrosine autokinase [Planctomycetaceae bacterium]